MRNSPGTIKDDICRNTSGTGRLGGISAGITMDYAHSLGRSKEINTLCYHRLQQICLSNRNQIKHQSRSVLEYNQQSKGGAGQRSHQGGKCPDHRLCLLWAQPRGHNRIYFKYTTINEGEFSLCGQLRKGTSHCSWMPVYTENRSKMFYSESTTALWSQTSWCC